MVVAGKKYLFIAGCGHSGSTFIQFLLFQHYNVLCVGEIGNSVRHISDKNFERTWEQLCSCGKKGCDCGFWGDIIRNKTSSVNDLVSSVEEKLLKFQTPVVVDSSKRIHHYDLLTNRNPKVIYLVKNFCGWSSHGKTKRFFRQIGRSQYQISSDNISNEISKWVRKICQSDKDTFLDDPDIRKKMIKASQKNNHLLEKFLLNNTKVV